MLAKILLEIYWNKRNNFKNLALKTSIISSNSEEKINKKTIMKKKTHLSNIYFSIRVRDWKFMCIGHAWEQGLQTWLLQWFVSIYTILTLYDLLDLHFLVIWSLRDLSSLFLSIPSLVMASVDLRVMPKIDWWYENRFAFYFHSYFAWEGDFSNFCNLWGKKRCFPVVF